MILIENKNKYTNKDLLHLKVGDLEFLQFKILNKYKDKIKHCITLRHGGVSTGDVSSLNFRFESEEDKNNVIKNLNLIVGATNMDSINIYKAKQNHTDNILILNNENKQDFKLINQNSKEYDGYIYSDKNIATLITTADCNAIIIYDPINNILANIHSGWKGTIKKIYIKAIQIMKEKYNTRYSDVIVCIGPSIQKCCFSSKEKEFKNRFTQVWKNEKEYIEYDKEDKDTFHIDLLSLIKEDLREIGIKEENMIFSDICTCCNHDDFFSYRYGTKTKQNNYGTMATIVGLI